MTWKLVEYVGLVLFSVIVPRVMGPDMYGRFAALLSLFGLLVVISGLGVLPTFGRFVPEYQVQGEKLKIQVLFTQSFFVRVLVAVFLSVVFVLLFTHLLPGTSLFTIAAGVGALLLGVPGITFYQFFYGLNALGKWLSQESLVKLLLLIGLFLLGGMYSLDRAALALFLTQLCLFLLGLVWTRSYFTFSKPVMNLSLLNEHLRFGLHFFSANLLLMVVWRAGEVVVLLFSGETTEVAFFNIANLVAMAVAALISQLAFMLSPSLTVLHVSGEQRRVDAWLGYSLKYLTIASFAFLFAVYTLGEWAVKLVWGEEYFPVIANLKVLALGLLAVPLVRTGISLAILHRRPGELIQVTAGALLTFIVVCAALISRTGSYGASVAVASALGIAGMLSYYKFPLAQVLAIARFWRLLFLGLLSLGIIALPLALGIPLGLISVIFFTALLFGSKVVSLREIQHIGQALVT